ncbi:MAG: hypothetical protein ACRD4P_03915, partial [Bryobacteraceae bacterium]
VKRADSFNIVIRLTGWGGGCKRLWCGLEVNGEKARAVDAKLIAVPCDEAEIEERFFDCASRRFAQNQRRGTLRSE